MLERCAGEIGRAPALRLEWVPVGEQHVQYQSEGEDVSRRSDRLSQQLFGRGVLRRQSDACFTCQLAAGRIEQGGDPEVE